MNYALHCFHTTALYSCCHFSSDPVQLKMVLIKCCDISNEVRPMEVAEPWVDCLLEEYFMQVGPTHSFKTETAWRAKSNVIAGFAVLLDRL